MHLERLEIVRLESWRDKSRALVGKLEVAGTDVKQEIKLDEETCKRILMIAGEAIRQGARQTAAFLESEASELTLLVENQEPAS